MVLPIHDINPLRRRPVVTWLLIAVNVVVFVFFEPVVTSVAGADTTTPASVCEQERFFDRWGAVPTEILENRPASKALTGQAVGVDPQGHVLCQQESPPPYTKPPVLSVLTAMFLHGSWLHLLGNMLFLGVFGNNVEDRMGRFLYLIFYLACGYVATYGFALFESDSTTTLIGASGAVAGVLGAYLVVFPRARVIGLVTFLFFLPFWLPAWIVLGFWFLLQYVYFIGMGVAEGGSVAYGAHVVGFVFGALAVLPFVRKLRAAGPARYQPPDQWWVRRMPWP
ncbi:MULTISPECIES: rhomboid family intramembrane serine protease [unclassified Frankia]|uniref:rhomboid family intramembrane serine protease n=1 Tax=unclassified Frankia TaxID=2632575 RepID=UPI002023F1F0